MCLLTPNGTASADPVAATDQGARKLSTSDGTDALLYEGLTRTSRIAIISAQNVESAVGLSGFREYKGQNHGEEKC